MRKILLMVGIFLNSFAFCQVAEDFSDGELLHHPQWVKDTGRFFVNTNKQLQTKAINKSDTTFLSTSSNYLLNTAWEFYVQINADPSTTNQIRIYLAFDHSNLDSSGNGYFLQIGESGTSDSYDLFRKTGKTITKIIDGPAKVRARADTVKVWFYIIHRVDGYWELYSRTNPLDVWNPEGNCFDRTHRISNFTGVSVKHTSTRSDKFIVDDISIYPYEIDTSAPEYMDIEIQDSTIFLLFSEEIDTNGLGNSNNFKLNANLKPKQVFLNNINKSLVQLKFNQLISGGLLNLEIPPLSDLLGNKNDTSYKIRYNYIAPIRNKRNDVFISEIMADPVPAIDLPESEFVEWYNNSEVDINLENWNFVNGNSTIRLKSKILKANSFLIICKASDTTLWKPYGEVIGLSTWPSIGNTSGSLKIIDPYGTLIDEMNYSNTWYKNKSKANGGYTLECTQKNKSCEGIYVWEASNSTSGGSPGSANSFWSLASSTFFVYQFDFLNDSSIYLRFSKAIDSTHAQNQKSFQLNTSKSNPKKISKINDFYTEYILTFDEKFKNNRTYNLNLSQIKTCDAETLDEPIYSFLYRNYDDTSLIRINEIMIDPSPSVSLPEVEYIELFNTTNNYVNLSSYVLSIGSTRLILPNYLLQPNEYIIIGQSSDSLLMQAYGTFIGFNTFPTLSNASSTITLFNKVGRLIDRVSYKNTWYRDQTKADGGWSLELIDPYTKCNEINRWSASLNKRGGSPGMQNTNADFFSDKKDLTVRYIVNTRSTEFFIGFNKPVQGYLINPAQLYFVGPRMKLFFPQIVQLDSPYYEKAVLKFNSPVPPGNYNLICQYIPSCGRNDTNIIYPFRILEMEQAEEEIAVSEIMADPSPSRGLPDAEFIELINTSDKHIPYIKFYISDTKDTTLIEIENWQAKETIVFCDKSTRMEWPDSIRVVALSKLPSLDNTNDTISVLNSEKILLSKVGYHINQLPPEKKEGGYTYSKIDNTWNCIDAQTWQASLNEMGGSPGFRNEKLENYVFNPILVNEYNFIANDTVEIKFNYTLSTNNEISIANEQGKPIPFELNEQGNIVIPFILEEAEMQSVKIYIKNCLNITLDTNLYIHKKYIPKIEDILLTEILFNPNVGSYDFVEIYNNSNKIINVEDLKISNGKDTYSLTDLNISSSQYKYIRPREYRVFTENKEDILNQYYAPNRNHVLAVKKLPSMPDEEGNVELLNSEELLLDKFVYNENMHLSWLENIEGRSLERKRLEQITEISQNWSSASDNIGKASPTGTNSQYTTNESTFDKSFWLSKALVKPYSKGSENKLELNYKLEGENVFMNAKLFSVSGSFISEVLHGMSIRNSGTVQWDIANEGKLIPAGTYILNIECFSENGKYQQYKLPFAVHY